ncbi:hypothetical protein ACWD2L_00600 [Streptomyces sp. NPDC002754]
MTEPRHSSQARGIVYALAHPRTGEIRYIGSTTRTAAKRFAEYRYSAAGEARRRDLKAKGLPFHDSRPLGTWLRHLWRYKMQPVMIILRSGIDDKTELRAAEREAIIAHADQGARLLNVPHNKGRRDT